MKTQTIEVATIKEAMVFTRGNQSEMARILDINRGSLRTYLKENDRNVRVMRDSFGKITALELMR